MDERLKFIARLLDWDKMAGLCREFGVSRKAGYKILARYNEIGRARREHRHPQGVETQEEHPP
jgi:putative transposase